MSLDKVTDWWSNPDRAKRFRLVIDAIFAVVLIWILVVQSGLGGSVDHLQNGIDATKQSRDVYFTEQRGIECEILHKLDGYTPVCNLAPTPGSPVPATTTTVPGN